MRRGSPQSIRGLGSVVSYPNGNTFWCILKATSCTQRICRLFEFVTFWGKTEVWGNCYLCPNVEPPQLIVGVGCGVCVYCLSVVDTSSVGTCCRMLVAVLLLLVVVL